MKPSRLITLLALACAVVPIRTAWAEVSPTALETLVIQDGGRRKPFLVFAEESLRSLSGKISVPIHGRPRDSMSVVTGIWMDPSGNWMDQELILISNRPLKQHLGLDPTRKLFAWNTLSSNEALAKLLAEGSEMRRRDPRMKLTGLEKEAADVGLRMGLLESLVGGEAYRVIPPIQGSDWQPVGHSRETDLLNALRGAWMQGDQDAFNRAVRDLNALQRKPSSQPAPQVWKITLETLYQRAHPFLWSWILYAAAGVLLMVLRETREQTGYRLAWILAGSGFVLQTSGLLARVLVAGRPPVTNMYESVIWVAFGTILFALVFESIHRAGTFLLGAVPVAVASLILADSQPMILDRSIHPLTPVLRDNFWLTTHVLSITLSYAAFALSLGVAHVALIRVIAGTLPSQNLYSYLYRTLQVGVLLLAMGTILGGVWANYSWGRFWDWDPKETWALITLLGYLFLLHGRISGLWGGFGLAVGSVLAFLSVLMAWYGVNFVLGSGLHSYGFGTGGFPLVATFVGLEITFLTVAVLRKRSALPR